MGKMDSCSFRSFKGECGFSSQLGELSFWYRLPKKRKFKRELFPLLAIPDNNPSGLESQIDIESAEKSQV
jgi:hypothetical protein